jgi:hypothetical protein
MSSPQPSSPTENPTAIEQLGEIFDLGGGFVVAALPFLLTAVPGLALFFVFPALLLLAVAAVPILVLAILLGPPVLVWRLVRGRPRGAP